MKTRHMFAICIFSMPCVAMAQTTVVTMPVTTTLPLVTVSGTQSGPHLWKVTKQDHVMWILGTLSPLPAAVTWQSEEVVTALHASQEVLKPPSSELALGRFKRLMMISKALGSAKNPDGMTLADLVSKETYDRWVELNAKYSRDSTKLGRYRPFFVAHILYQDALKHSGLNNKDQVGASVLKMAHDARLKVTDPIYEYAVDDPDGYVKETMAQQGAGIRCLGEVIDVVENDMDVLTVRADAWAVGDLDYLEEHPVPHSMEVCRSEFQDPSILAKYGVNDLQARTRKAWMDAAEAALTKNTTTFAFMPLEQLRGRNGYLDMLLDKGYEVVRPKNTPTH
ncbi:TraB/GumN family protein [Dyella kyungheensis]|uniref:TraB/GumN family protein n=1 Tax=Dyella kyungheensis TaxID=1242174 RepID=UPI003CE6825B